MPYHRWRPESCQRLALGLSNASASRSSAVSCFGGVFRSVKNVSTTVIDHEQRRDAEHPVRHVLVHDPAEQQRADDAAEIEPGGDDGEGAAGRTGGAALRTSMSRDGAITPPRKPADRHRRDQRNRRQGHERDDQHDCGVDGEADGRDLAVTLGPVGEKAACEHADGAGAEVGGQRDVGGRERGGRSRSSARPRRNWRCRRWRGRAA